MLLGVVVGSVAGAPAPDIVELALGFPAFEPVKTHVIPLGSLGDHSF